MIRALPLALSLWSSLAVAATAPHKSFNQVVSSNGYTAVIYDDTKKKVTDFREHIYQAVDASTPVRNLAFDAYFGLRLGGTGRWLNDVPLSSLNYVPGTGVIEAVQKVGEVEATTFVFAPFEISAPAAVMLLKVKNTGSAALGANDAAYSLHNFHLGEGTEGLTNERIDWDATRGLFVERHDGGGRVMVFLPIGAPSHRGCTPNNPWGRLGAGQDLADDSGSGKVNDAVSGLQWSLAGLGAGEERWFGVALAYHPFSNDAEIADKLKAWLGTRAPSALLPDEVGRWSTWHAAGKEPANLSLDERALYRQQLAILRMAQVREPNDEQNGYLPHGQILASLPPGMWNITWVRDGLVAIQALIKSGHTAEARAGLEFFLKAKSSTYEQYVGAPYQISVVRYFGKGLEESDSNGNGPNIEWDGFGMFLDGLDAYERATGDLTLADAYWEKVTAKTADVLVGLATDEGLLKADSSIWETHWDNGGRQHWTWSQLYGVLGLKAASAVAARHNKADLVDRYQQASDKVRAAIFAKLVEPDGFLRGRSEATPVPEDGAVLEAFVRSVIDPKGAIAQATVARLRTKLALPTGPGFKRNLGPDDYDKREWILIDMRMATAMRFLGATADAEAIIDWVTQQSRANYNLIAENYNPTTADYEGAIPMVGFGAGAYALALFARNETPEPALPGPDAGTPGPDASAPGLDAASAAGDASLPSASDAGTAGRDGGRGDAGSSRSDAGDLPEESGGCGCTASSAALLPAAAALAAGLLRTRRRK